MTNLTAGPSAFQRPAATKLRRAGLRAAVCLAPMIILAGCAAFPEMNTMVSRPGTRVEEASQDGLIGGGVAVDRGSRAQTTSTLAIPGPPPPASPTRLPATPEQIAALVSDEMVDANLSPQAIPQFAATVFGGVLKVPFTLAPEVATRSEVIAGGSGGPITKRALFSLTQQALKQYGVDVYIDGGFVTVGATPQGGTGVEINRSRTPTTSTGRVVQFYTIQTIAVDALQGLLRDLYPNLRGTRITPDPLNNSLIISGSGREVAQVVQALREIDQPRFAGAEVLRIEPSFWAADALAAALEQALTAEGYMISRQVQVGRALVVLSFPTANQILIFGHDPALLARARYWAETLDQPAALGDKASTFVYQVKNTDAASLGQLAMGQAPTTAQARPPVGVPGTPPAPNEGGLGAQQTGSRQPGAAGQSGGSGKFMNGQVLIDPSGNRIIFTGTATEFAQLRSLLTTLDTPAPQVVIEVMIAEVTLSDNTSLGVQLFGTDVRGDGVLSGGTEGIEIGGGGLLMSFIGPEFRARLNAQASNNRVNILQRPQLVARSGGTARFQVGTDVPIITSQRASDNQNNNNSDILQSVQYRQTGVILDLQPVVYGDRVDITISQEISEVGKSTNPAIASPPILNRSLTTQIAITDGWTGVLGGLISNNYAKVNDGIPFLKDVPLIGSAFQNNSVEGKRTELLILITPHVLRGDEDMADYAERYAADMNAAFRTGRGWSYTLTPFNVGFGVRGVGFDLPSPNRPSDRRAAEATVAAPAAAPAAPAPTEPIAD